MIRARPAAFALVLLMLTCAGRTGAQVIPGLPVAVEGSIGLVLPSGELAESGRGISAEAGPVVAVGLRVQPIPMLGFYGRYRYTNFGCGECEAIGLDDRAPAAEWDLGLRLDSPQMLGPMQPWASGAITRSRIQISGPTGRITSQTGTGLTAGVGLSLPFANRFQVSPGLHYRRFPGEFDLTSPVLGGGAAGISIDVESWSLEVAMEAWL